MESKKAALIQERIEDYFASRRAVVCEKDGSPALDERGSEIYEFTRPPTVTGLARSLGFESREAMRACPDKKSAAAIAAALLVVEEYAEEKLFCKESFSGTKLFLAVNFPRWRAQEEAQEPFPEEYGDWAK